MAFEHLQKGLAMLANRNAMATIAVRDLAAARTFYGDQLGLTPAGDEAGVLTFESGNSTLVVYESAFAGSNRATSATWGVGDEFDAIVSALHAAGVRFEHYDELPGMTRQGDVHLAGDFRAAWFKDPDGNILHLNNG